MAEHISFPVKQITWSQYEHETPILLQEANGPCPLIALVNTLLLQNDIQKRESQLNPKSNSVATSSRHVESIGKIRSLLHRHLGDRVSLSEVLGCLGDVLLDIYDHENSVVNRLLESLPLLHTGLSVNPNLYMGGFPEHDLSTEIFDAFGLSFVHGWLWDPVSQVHEGHFKKLQTFDSIQDYLLNPQLDPRIKADIKQWLEHHSTQLTLYGLRALDERMEPDTVAVFFRNNHFSTIYKAHDHDFYLLITDSAFATGQCVWQSIISVSGGEDLFFRGDFVPILENSEPAGFLPHEDLELVRQLQEEEDAAMALRMQKRYDGRQQPRAPTEKTERFEKSDKIDKKKKKATRDTADEPKSEGVPKKSKLTCVIV